VAGRNALSRTAWLAVNQQWMKPAFGRLP